MSVRWRLRTRKWNWVGVEIITELMGSVMTLINLHLGLFSKLVDISILVFHLLIRSFSYAVAHSYGGIAVVLKSAKLDVGVPNV